MRYYFVMLKYKLLPLILLMSCATAYAFDFADTLPSGQVLYYSYVAGGVEVVHPNANVSSGWTGYTKPSGPLTVPATVSHDGTVYAVTAIGDYAFRYCTGLTSVVLSDGIASVGSSAFYACTGIVDLTLPASIASLGNGAFSLLGSLSDVWMWSAVPPTTSSTAFYSIDLTVCTLHVPCGAAVAYGSAVPWNSFGSLVEGDCTAYIATEVNDPARGYVTGSGSYMPGTAATLTAFPATGYSFICWSDGDTLNPRVVQVLSDSLFKAMFFPVTVVHDTVMPTTYTINVLSDNTLLGLGVGSAVLPAGVEVEVCGLPMEGARFVAWEDGNVDNPRRVMVMGTLTLRALFEPLSADMVEQASWTLTAADRWLTVCCGVGERLCLYDSQGRCHTTLVTTAPATILPLPAAGVWLVQVGHGAARRIVIE